MRWLGWLMRVVLAKGSSVTEAFLKQLEVSNHALNFNLVKKRVMVLV
jgi:hypothetical protein